MLQRKFLLGKPFKLNDSLLISRTVYMNRDDEGSLIKFINEWHKAGSVIIDFTATNKSSSRPPCSPYYTVNTYHDKYSVIITKNNRTYSHMFNSHFENFIRLYKRIPKTITSDLDDFIKWIKDPAKFSEASKLSSTMGVMI